MAYRERLTVPPIWWVLAFLLASSCGVAVGFYVGPVLGVTVGLLALGSAAALLASSATSITVDDQRLRVGRAMIDIEYVGKCRALDVAETSRRAGQDADARAFLTLRPYVKTAVEVAVVDAADPVPYWLISTRHPRKLATALESVRADESRGRGSLL